VDLVRIRQDELYVAAVEQQKFEDFVGLRGMLLPVDVFESRAAEYDIDPDSPTGWDDLFHMVLGPPGDDRPVEEMAEDPNHLYNAPSIERAREAKLGRIRQAMGARKLRGLPGASPHRLKLGGAVALGDSGAEDPLEFIKRTAPMSRAHIAVKQEYVRRNRTLIRARRAGRNPEAMVDPNAPEEKAVRDMKLHRRETPEQLAQRLLGAPLDRERETAMPPRLGTPSKYL